MRKKKEYFQRKTLGCSHSIKKKPIPHVLFFLLLRRHTPPPLLSSYFSDITMVKVCISSDIIKPFSGEGDVVTWLKKVRRGEIQQVDDVASPLPLYLEGDALALYMEMEEDDQKQIE